MVIIMSLILQIFLIISLFLFLLLILYYLGKKKLNLKYSLLWLFACLFMIIVTLFPKLVNCIGNILGIATPVNTIFLFHGMFITLILLTLTFIVSHLKYQIYRLAQTIALLEKSIRDLEQNHNCNDE